MTKRNNKSSQPAQTVTGDEVRTAATSRENQTPTQPEDAATAAAGTGDVADNIAHLHPQGSRSNIFNAVAMDESHRIAEKMRLMGDAKQRLAEARDLATLGEEHREEAEETASKAIILLYQGRANGLVSAEEVSGALGDQFGYKPKRDGSPGRTPAGMGEPIRKRVVRLSQAYQFATADGEEEVSAFFNGMDKGDVAQILNEVENDNLSPWQAYRNLADLKTKRESVNPAFDAKKVAGMAAALTEGEAISRLAANPGLWKAYGTLMNVLRVIGEDETLIAAYEEAKAKAA